MHAQSLAAQAVSRVCLTPLAPSRCVWTRLASMTDFTLKLAEVKRVTSRAYDIEI